MSKTIQEQVEDLQVKYAFQEETITVLNDVLIKQQKKIDLLGEQVQLLINKMNALSDSVPEQNEGPPPHY